MRFKYFTSKMTNASVKIVKMFTDTQIDQWEDYFVVQFHTGTFVEHKPKHNDGIYENL